MKFCVKELEVLYLDNHLLAVNKPAPLLTQSNKSDAPNLEALSREWVKKRYQKRGNVFLHPIHRLDKSVSGIVLFARTSKALSRLNAQIRDRAVQKIYFAQVEGQLHPHKKTLKHTLIHGSHHAHISPLGKEALLSYTIHKSYPFSTLVEIVLHTGRYHQIRAQCAHIGHPIIGDGRYGSVHNSSQIALHHSKMIFTHPTLKKKIVVLSQPLFLLRGVECKGYS